VASKCSFARIDDLVIGLTGGAGGAGGTEPVNAGETAWIARFRVVGEHPSHGWRLPTGRQASQDQVCVATIRWKSRANLARLAIDHE
jgi:hypothetical protein